MSIKLRQVIVKPHQVSVNLRQMSVKYYQVFVKLHQVTIKLRQVLIKHRQLLIKHRQVFIKLRRILWIYATNKDYQMTIGFLSFPILNWHLFVFLSTYIRTRQFSDKKHSLSKNHTTSYFECLSVSHLKLMLSKF